MALLTLRRALLPLLLLGGCMIGEEPTFPTALTRAVHAVLAAGSDTASVLLTELASGGAGIRPVVGAAVSLTRGQTVYHLEHSGASCRQAAPPAPGPVPPDTTDLAAGCYSGVIPGGIPAGSSWTLLVRFPDGGVATGAATIPQRPEILAPAAGEQATVLNGGREVQQPGTLLLAPLGRIPLKWRVNPPVGRLEVATLVMPASTRPGPERLDCALSLLPTSSVDLVGGAIQEMFIFGARCGSGAPIAWDTIRARLVFSAFDTAYARYSRELFSRPGESRSIRTELASAGITGAAGVFAGVASTTVPITLVASDSLPAPSRGDALPGGQDHPPTARIQSRPEDP